MATFRRSEYLIDQKNKGKHLLGVFPAQYPKELLWAFNILPVEIWDPKTTLSKANAHLQPYTCSIVRHGLELILDGQTDILDGFLFPHTCDSLQNLGSIVNDFLDNDKKCFFFYHPKSPYRSAKDYYTNHLTVLTGQLEKHFGQLDTAQLEKSMAVGNKISAISNELYEFRSKGLLNISNAEFYRSFRLGEYLHPNDFIKILEEMKSNCMDSPQKTPAVVLSGILPNPSGILDLLDNHHVRVAHDDLLNGSRRLKKSITTEHPPFEEMNKQYFDLPPCSTKNSPVSERLNYLESIVNKSNARGIIFNITKFCEPELFDLPQLRAGLKEMNIPSLTVETEVNQGVSGQLVTRIEAFLEMIGN